MTSNPEPQPRPLARWTPVPPTRSPPFAAKRPTRRSASVPREIAMRKRRLRRLPAINAVGFRFARGGRFPSPAQAYDRSWTNAETPLREYHHAPSTPGDECRRRIDQLRDPVGQIHGAWISQQTELRQRHLFSLRRSQPRSRFHSIAGRAGFLLRPLVSLHQTRAPNHARKARGKENRSPWRIGRAKASDLNNEVRATAYFNVPV